VSKSFFRLFTSALTALILISSVVLLSGCGPASVPDGTSEPVTDAQTVDGSRFFFDSEYLLVRPEKAGDAVKNACTELRAEIEEKCSIKLTIKDDWLKPGDNPPAKEILIGATARPESEKILEGLPLNGYAIEVVGDKIVVNARSESVLLAAIERFSGMLGSDGSIASVRVEGAVDRPIASLKINGKSLEEYSLVYQDFALSSAATGINSILENLTGAALPVYTLKNAPEGPKFLLGRCGEGEPDISDYGTYGYCVSAVDEGLSFNGKLAESVIQAFNIFADRYLAAEGDVSVDLKQGEKVIDVRLESRDAYIADPSLLPMKWAASWQPGAALLDYDAKIACLNAEDKNHIFTVSHRGDFLRYPENSIEAVISVWRMGGDCVEIDIHYTADGVAVLIHDDTLTRTTNCADYLGKEGFPSDANVSSWTLAQLRQLRLKSGQGGSSATMTEYVIPTLEEALIAAKGRFFLILDKQTLWRYADIPGVQTEAQPNFIYPLMKSTGNFESVLISYGTIEQTMFTAEQALAVQKYVYDNDGAKMYFFLRGWTTRSNADPYASTLEKSSLTNSAILVNGAFDPTNTSVKNAIKNLVKMHPNSMFGGWTIDSNGYDKEATWDIMYSLGLRSIMTNNILALVKYASQKIGG